MPWGRFTLCRLALSSSGKQSNTLDILQILRYPRITWTLSLLLVTVSLTKHPPSAMTVKRKSNPSPTASESNSVKKPRLDQDQTMDEARPMTDKEKRKAARMIRNRQSAQM